MNTALVGVGGVSKCILGDECVIMKTMLGNISSVTIVILVNVGLITDPELANIRIVPVTVLSDLAPIGGSNLFDRCLPVKVSPLTVIGGVVPAFLKDRTVVSIPTLEPSGRPR